MSHDQLPVAQVSDTEMDQLLDALGDGQLTVKQRTRLWLLLISFQVNDSEPDDEDRETRNWDHATSWRVARQYWRRLIAAWREEHPQVDTPGGAS